MYQVIMMPYHVTTPIFPDKAGLLFSYVMACNADV